VPGLPDEVFEPWTVFLASKQQGTERAEARLTVPK
jgi:hypothetical protein